MDNWLPHSVIYQVNLRSFAAREPRNPVEAATEQAPASSPLAYLAEHLPTVQHLGVSVLHLMPIFPMGREGRKGIGSPYACRDYLDVEPEFGTKADLALLVRTAHDLGMKVILGMVPNHTSRDHVWLEPHPEYFVRDKQDRPIHDLDWSDTVKLNYLAAGLREAMTNVLDHWLTFLDGDGVDGFRFDMAHFINDCSFWNDAFAAIANRHPDRRFLFLAECYGMDNNLDLFGRGMTAAYDDEFYKVCEQFYALQPGGQSVVSPRRKDQRDPLFHRRMGLFRTGGLAAVFADAIEQYERTFPDEPCAPLLARYTDNHDEGRGLYRFGEGGMRAANLLVFLTPRTLPFLLAGQEFGALNRPSIHDRIRPCEKGHRVVDASGERWQDGVEFEGNLFARGPAARAGWYAFYRDLIRLRHETPALVQGDFHIVDLEEDAPPPDQCVLAFDRCFGGRHVRCAVNLGPSARRLARADALAGNILYGKLEGDRLAPFSGIVVDCGEKAAQS
jgi:glycosidase